MEAEVKVAKATQVELDQMRQGVVHEWTSLCDTLKTVCMREFQEDVTICFQRPADYAWFADAPPK